MSNNETAQLTEIAASFAGSARVLKVEPYGSGHINRTYRVLLDGCEPLLLQRISPAAFHHPEQVMANIVGITRCLTEKINAAGGDPLRETLTVIPTREGRSCLTASDGGCWRAYRCIADTITLQLPEHPEDMREAGRAFGRFQLMLRDYPADRLYETIPQFHDTPNRIRAFRRSAAEDPAGRAASAEHEIAFVEHRAQRSGALTGQLAAGVLPLRVTHNDTKLNNVLLDAATRKALCVVDLDTVMPGLTAYDFGDAIRFGANTAVEDEADLSRVRFSLPMYRAWCEGFLGACGSMLTPAELRSLPEGAWMMTFEVGLRFLTDYLDGDIYFHTAYPEHNLVRARCQFALLADMEHHEADMLQEVLKYGQPV